MFGNDYSEWLDRYAMLDRLESEDVNAHLKRSKNTPLISIVMPVYNPNLVWLNEAIQSVRDQLYPHWQLCIADDKSTDPKVREVLLNYQALDERIKVTFRAANGHISAASNSALEHSGLLPLQSWSCHGTPRSPSPSFVFQRYT